MFSKILELCYILIWTTFEILNSIYYFFRYKIHQKKEDLENAEIPVSVIDNSIFSELGEGVISMSFIPGGKVAGQRDLENDIDKLKQLGVTHMVTLVRDKEIVYDRYFEVIQNAGIESVRFAIVDKTVPLDLKRYHEVVNKMIEIVENGGVVHVHCRGGKGRAGTFVFAMLQLFNIGLFRTGRTMRKLNEDYFRNPFQIVFMAFYCFMYTRLDTLFYQDTCRHVFTDI